MTIDRRHREPLFRCTAVQACLALIPVAIILAGIVYVVFARLNQYDVRPIIPGALNSQGYPRIDYHSSFLEDVRNGDWLRWPALTLEARLVLVQYRFALPGKPLTYPIQRGDQQIDVVRIPPARPLLPPDKQLTLWLQFFVALVILAVGTLLVLLRPSKVTWAWFLLSLSRATVMFAMSRGNVGFPAGYSYLPPQLHLVVSEAISLLSPAAYFGLLVFALYFPDRRPEGVARLVDRLVPYLFVIVAVIYLATDVLEVRCYCEPGWLDWAANTFDVAIPLAALMFAGSAYFHSRGIERQKITWMAVAIAVALAPYVLGNILQVFVFDPHNNMGLWFSWTRVFQWLTLLYIVPALALAYVVIRHRVFDIRFIITHTIVLGVLAVMVIAVFASIDWILTSLAQTRLTTAAYIGAALVLGFGMKAAQHRVSNAVNSLFFRDRHQAGEDVDRIISAMHQAKTASELSRLLVEGAAKAFGLASSAIFTRTEDGGFIREAAIGWPIGTAWHLLPGDPLAEKVIGAREVARFDELAAPELDLPGGPAQPAIGFPIRINREVGAIILYGAHESGAVPDPDEVGALKKLVREASAIYAALAASAREQLADILEQRIAQLQGE